MRVTTLVALMACLAVALPIHAQLPREPLSGGAAGAAKTTTTPESSSRQSAAAFVTRQSDVEIPFTVRPGSTPETQPAAVRVFVSWDRGKSWHFYEEIRPQAGRF